MIADYRVRLSGFSGPMDLLLHLVRERELEIAGIPLGEIAEDFVARVRAMDRLDMEAASEFLVLAATLMEIKARSLLPREPGGEDGGDPHWELVQKLLEYRRFKDASVFLAARGERMACRRPRPEPPPPSPPEGVPGESAEPGNPWALFQAYARLALALAPPRTATVRATEVPLERLRAELLARCEGGPWSLEAREERGRVVGLFLAVLELVRLGLLRARQEILFGPIVCEREKIVDAG